MRLFACALIVGLFVGHLAAQDPCAIAKARAKAILLLDAENPVSGCGDCVDLETALARAGQEKFVFIWVGGCLPEIRAKFPDCEHANVTEHQGSSAPRLVVPTNKGNYNWEKDKIDPNRIRAVIGPMKTSKAFSCPAGCPCGCAEGEPCRCPLKQTPPVIQWQVAIPQYRAPVCTT